MSPEKTWLFDRQNTVRSLEKRHRNALNRRKTCRQHRKVQFRRHWSFTWNRFERNSRDYSWQTKSRSESRRESSSRERSSQTKLVQSIRQRFSSFHSQNSPKSSSIELQNVQSADRWIFLEKFFLLKKSRRSVSLRSFIESSSRSISASFILSSSSSFSLSPSSHRANREKSSAQSFKSIESIRIESDHEKELANLAKLYTDEAKYSDENDSCSFKLTIFHDMCDRVNVSQSVKLKTFFIMFKDLAFDYYYSNMFINDMILIIFDEVCFSMRNYFEDAEYRRSFLFKWNNLILKSVMTSNESKSVEECLQLLIKQLRHLQHDLNSKLRSEKFIHNKLINACQDVFVCQYVCFKLSDSLIDLINDLRSSIIIYQKVNSTNFIETFETFFIDRRYHKNFSLRLDNFSFRINQNRRYLSKKICFVCQKKNVDQRNIQKMNVRRQSRNSKIHFSSELITTSLNMKKRIRHLLSRGVIIHNTKNARIVY